MLGRLNQPSAGYRWARALSSSDRVAAGSLLAPGSQWGGRQPQQWWQPQPRRPQLGLTRGLRKMTIFFEDSGILENSQREKIPAKTTDVTLRAGVLFFWWRTGMEHLGLFVMKAKMKQKRDTIYTLSDVRQLIAIANTSEKGKSINHLITGKAWRCFGNNIEIINAYMILLLLHLFESFFQIKSWALENRHKPLEAGSPILSLPISHFPSVPPFSLFSTF